MKMNNHHILSNTATWQRENDHLPKVTISNDGNNNCLVYEGGYFNGERWGKGISYDLTGNIDYEGEWIHEYMGYVILESMIWFDLIWFD